MSLATKYRPKDFSEVVGQQSTVRILQRQIDKNEIAHSYLFIGNTGCGKTTLARCFALKLNGTLDGVIELDAASNNGVDNVRNIIKSANERSITSKYKVIIIDECHSLSNQGWQAFLKCIEEPPQYSIFIFCTTDPQKIPQTIQNRCQRYVITKIPLDKIIDRLNVICRAENINCDVETLTYIAKLSEGSMRQAITFLEQTYNYDSSQLTAENVIKAVGIGNYEEYFSLVNFIIDRNLKGVSEVVNNLYNNGIDLKIFIDQFFIFCLDITKYCLFQDINLTSLPSFYLQKINDSTNFDNANKYYMHIVDKIMELKNQLKTESCVKQFVEASLLKLATWS